LTRIAKKIDNIYICSVCHKEKQKKRLPRVPRQGHSGEVFLKKGEILFPSAWDGALGEED
jgi:hypothetical protein